MAKVASLHLTIILMLLLSEITFGQPPYFAGYRNDAIQQWRNGYGSEAKRTASDSWPDVKKSDILLRFGKRLPDGAQRWQGEDFQNVLLRFG